MSATRLLVVLLGLAPLVPRVVLGGFRITSVNGNRFEIGVGSAQGVKAGLTGRVVDPGFTDESGQPIAVAVCRITSVQTASAQGEVTDIGTDFHVTVGMEVAFDQPLAPAPAAPRSSSGGADPACTVSASELEFGEVAVGQSADKAFTIRNAGGGRLEGSVSLSSGSFQVVAGAGSYSLGPGESFKVRVRFAPTAEGPASRTVVTGEMCGNVVCRGTGVEGSPGSSRNDRSGSRDGDAGQGGGRGTAPAGFVLVNGSPPVTFTMGSRSSEPGRDSDETQHQVTLTRAFYLSDHEVTQVEWQAVMGWDESSFNGDNRPVENVTWFDCVDFCNKKSDAAGLTRAYTMTGASYSGNHITSATVTWNQSASGYRLPTEAEWEYACRAGSTTAFCNGGITELSCGNEPNLTRVGWYCGNASGTTRQVKGKTANDWSIYDMHGNVYEWCWDWYGMYPGTVTDPTGAGSGTDRVLRGGSWIYIARYCRSANRYFNTPGYRYYNIGLRLSRTAP